MRITRYHGTESIFPVLRYLLVGALLFAGGRPALAFDLDDVAAKAKQLASQPYQARTSSLPPDLKALSYDQYRDIRFKPEQAQWRRDKLPFELMFFHLGKFQTQRLQINEIDEQGAVRHLPFDRADFDYGKNKLSPENWGDVGYAGFRAHYPLNTAAYKDEVVVFLGASYFRAVGAGQHYGLSARGLAIDTVGGKGEEFPRFSEFWIEKPKPGATTLVVYALLESPRAAGAYRFEVMPGNDTVIDVQSQLYLRGQVATLGIAPLTTMYMFGENQPHRTDFRPEVHDSDGLMVATGEGEWLWRPLINPKHTLTTSFSMKSLRGFGLMQRDRSFASYEDVEARYDQRPSAWITPRGDWGPGRVELVQLNTPDETHDNIVAYWVPEKLPAPGQPLSLAYQLRWQGEVQQRPPAAWVTQTRAGRGFDALAPNEHQYIVDFAGPSLDALAPDAAVKAVVSANANGQIVERNVYRNAANGTWRMSLRVKQRRVAQPVELRAFLQHGKDTLSETWTYVIPPK
ncbi:putative periplasmic glucans biosynthesis signal peptide protein [Thiobacillus denitrificans ATCC 25259]|uniref:Glucans biosynthesis protein G n=1 Tax=Thiobacillus denitrificans (strain ATCC 25259 / T1) TaxID=292415 RepID=Q3SJA3_THIDA|nr:glucan biosynthesis protein G [Thiobacillus denitrificans]AAZ97264.1 putative periplasmic glucans biosynthesis signal peptide protein [Thiobacillus denitrificans ATCC 25259]